MSAQTAQQSPPAKHYTFGPREAGGLILGQSGGQLLLIAAILGMFLTILTPGLALAARVIVIAIMGLLLAFGWMPVYLGLPPIHWTRLFVSARLQRWTGQITYRGGLFRMRNDEWEVPAARLPGLLGATRWLELATGPSSPPIGLWHDHREHTYTAVLILEGSSFHLLETEEQERRESAYGRMLAALCDSARHLKRLQILERTVPDTGDTLHRDYTSRASHLVRPDEAHPPQAAIDSYEAVIAAAGPVGQRHETYVAVCLDAKSAARDIARAGGGDRGAAAVVDREIRRLSADLVSAGVRVHGYAPPRQLAYILRTAFDPAVRWSTSGAARSRTSRAVHPGWRPASIPARPDRRMRSRSGRPTARTPAGTAGFGSPSGRARQRRRRSSPPCCCSAGTAGPSRSRSNRGRCGSRLVGWTRRPTATRARRGCAAGCGCAARSARR